jgi:uncharacterized spore protein YtfJ
MRIRALHLAAGNRYGGEVRNPATLARRTPDLGRPVAGLFSSRTYFMNTSPDPQPLLNHFLDQFVHAAGTRAVFGEPVVLPYATVVPVAKVVWGVGAGFGGGGRAQAPDAANTTGSGGGYGGGAKAYPVGALDIRPERTRFIRTPSPKRHVLFGVVLGIALTQLLKLSSK